MNKILYYFKSRKIPLWAILGWLFPLSVFGQAGETGVVRQMQQLQEQAPADTKFADYFERLKINPKDSLIHLQLGQLYLERELLELAITSFRQALQYQPNMAQAHVGLSQVFRKKGLKPLELAEMEEAVRLDPNDAQIHYSLGVLYMEPTNFDYKKAEREFKTLEKMQSPLTEKLGVLMQRGSK
jgi:tetratricopeptide (TPR) repeat protein